MAKLIRMQKKLFIVLASFFLIVFQRTVSLARPFYRGNVRQSAAQAKKALLLRIASPLRPSTEAPSRYYAAEVNGSFPYFHAQRVAANPVDVGSVFADDPLEMTDLLGITVFSLSGQQSAQAPDSIGSPDQVPSVCPIDCCCAACTDCGGCGECSGCSDCTDCSDCNCS